MAKSAIRLKAKVATSMNQKLLPSLGYLLNVFMPSEKILHGSMLHGTEDDPARCWRSFEN